MGSCMGKRIADPPLFYFYTKDIKNILSKVNQNHPYIVKFLESYPCSSDYTLLHGYSFYGKSGHSHTLCTFYDHIRFDGHPLWQLGLNSFQYLYLNKIRIFKFCNLPVIQQKMSVGDLRDICNIVNRKKLQSIFKHCPMESEWAANPMPGEIVTQGFQSSGFGRDV